jgi:hypothetical protein
MHTQHDVSKDLIVRHLNVANSDTQAQNLFKLEFDSRLHLSELIGQVFSRRYGCREFSSCRSINNRQNETKNIEGTHPWKDQDQGDAGSA